MSEYSDPERENDACSLPDVEIFHMSGINMRECGKESAWFDEGEEKFLKPGWYYWFCFPGCMPESDPIGPFTTYSKALADCRENANGN